jgi:transposase
MRRPSSNREISRAKSRQALTLIRLLRALESQLDFYRDEIERLFDLHSDSDLYRSLPGVGKKLGAHLLGEIGSDRSMFPSSEALQCVTGTALRELPIRPDPQGLSSPSLQQVFASYRLPVG